MPSAIVTTTYRYKRPPRKTKPIVLTGSAIVRSGQRREDVSKPATPAPANDDRKSAIVTVASKRGRKSPGELPEDPEADARVKAFLARMVRPGGPLPPAASE